MADQAGRLAYAHGSAFTTAPVEAYAREVARAPADGRPGDLPGFGRFGGDRNGAQTGAGLSRRPRRARPLDRVRAVGELSRQHPGSPRPVRPQVAPTAVRGLARSVPPRVRGISVSGRRSSAPTPLPRQTSWQPSSTRHSRQPSQERLPRSSRNRSSGRRSGRSFRRTATGPPSPTSAAATGSCSSPTRS